MARGSRALVAAAALLGAGCPEKVAQRPYPPPTATELVAQVVRRARAIKTMRAEAKVDYLAAKGERIKVSTTLLADGRDRLRLDANSPFGGAALSLATDGREFELLDSRSNRFLEGRATPCNIARVIRVELAAPDAIAVIEGGAPLLGVGEGGALRDDVKAEVAWDGRDGGREVVTLRTPSGESESLALDARGRTYDVRSAELRDATGHVTWRVSHEDFGAVGGVRMPSRTVIEQPARKADTRIRFKEREVNGPAPEGAFRIAAPAGMAAEHVDAEPGRCD